MLRVQNRGRRTFFVMVESENGIDFKVGDKIVNFNELKNLGLSLHHLYDPRITKIDDEYFIMFAMVFFFLKKLMVNFTD